MDGIIICAERTIGSIRKVEKMAEITCSSCGKVTVTTDDGSQRTSTSSSESGLVKCQHCGKLNALATTHEPLEKTDPFELGMVRRV
ncbi:MAG: hypothetical protein IH630_01750 [Thermoplasmata archaeon]|nr:hypothetical protein [Thermoplasmata archaeon]TFG68720.1 MAG: hypothetical protein E4H25_05555 [Methanomassiliicoccus sp.]